VTLNSVKIVDHSGIISRPQRLSIRLDECPLDSHQQVIHPGQFEDFLVHSDKDESQLVGKGPFHCEAILCEFFLAGPTLHEDIADYGVDQVDWCGMQGLGLLEEDDAARRENGEQVEHGWQMVSQEVPRGRPFWVTLHTNSNPRCRSLASHHNSSLLALETQQRYEVEDKFIGLSVKEMFRMRRKGRKDWGGG
jgi:hypothetical protein